MTTYSVESATRPDFRASSTISGPIPAQSPSVMPMRGFVVLLLMLVIVIEFVHSARAGLTEQSKTQSKRQNDERAKSGTRSERLDIGLSPQAGDPAFLNLLGFFLDQFLLDIGAHFGERFRAAAVFILNFQDVIIAGVIDDVADSARRAC